MQLTVSTRALGRRKPLLSDFDVEPPGDLDDDGDLHLRELIAHVVRCQVTRFCSRQHARRFDRVLTAGEISDGAMAGKVDPAGKPTDQEVDEDAAISAALQAFEPVRSHNPEVAGSNPVPANDGTPSTLSPLGLGVVVFGGGSGGVLGVRGGRPSL